ncbi:MULTISPECIES: polysaccharide deacetylase family protein [Bacillus cereus group]|uniref:polysaccharide deacetylase family protein n=1 Tax=Bacillus cereus group TaxID=86661 RepID=UPI000E6C8BFE|nr:MULTISPECIES: polysaccharide deacetylase family protein [Bacillus cereus group]MDC7729810.1 polysaccharide deacetylase family protein [Bacillus cereus]MDZ4588493.1 polysaccharide deacetylase family protein [Bacillus cereus]MDZ4599569.1 polysaccharide deacetylase family protein [Bacillus cereus]RJE10820.1 chitooligosaccharide deacetylase [Bacillus cereus]TNO86603.1 polysaccharide deacetylase family protein [Bacillus cereus]
MISLCSKPISIYAFTDSRKEYEKTGKVIWEVNTKEKIVALTFDDGPHLIFTPQILDLLAKYNAKATFFVAGNKVKRFPAILIREVKEGHEIANHTYNHIYNKNITAAKLTSELNRTDKVIKQITGYKPTLYRPVGGLHNDLIINTAIQNGKLVILWSWHQDPQDWRSPAASQISKHIIKGVQLGNIILLHDWNGSEFSQTSQTVEALESILIHLKNNGYTCVTVSEMLYRSIKIIPSLFDPIYQ